jgi:hypothetical protein
MNTYIEVWVSKVEKILGCGRPGGRGVSKFGQERTKGEGGQKRANFCGRPIWMPQKKYGTRNDGERDWTYKNAIGTECDVFQGRRPKE